MGKEVEQMIQMALFDAYQFRASRLRDDVVLGLREQYYNDLCMLGTYNDLLGGKNGRH